jgi:signal transduction histidine kinase
MTPRARRRPRLPLFVYLLAFVMACLVAAEFVNIAIVLALPRPEPEFYALGEIEQELNGGLAGAVAKKFTADVRQAPPADSAGGVFQVKMERKIARDLGVPVEDVHFGRPSTNPFSWRPPPKLLQGPNGERWPAVVRRKLPFVSSRTSEGQAEPQIFLVPPFTVALKQADGTWRVVQPKRPSLLDPWEQHLLIWFLVSAAAMTPVAYLFARRLSAPFADFAAAAERLGRDPNAPALDLNGTAEIGVAAQAFNEMQRRLRRYVQDRTTLIGAVAHDLRTPLTRLRFHIEEAPEPLRGKMEADISQMDQMVAEVLAFVKDASQPGRHDKLELSSLLDTVADEFAEMGKDVRVQHAERAVVEGDSLALKRMFANLIDNAVKFGGRASAQLRRDEGAVVVDIEDEGPGLPSGELESVFEPFRRAEPSRSRDTGGIGLGLTVARSIARAHGGDVVLDNRAAGGLLARVRLPV